MLEQVILAVSLPRKKKVEDNETLCIRQKRKFLSNDGIFKRHGEDEHVLAHSSTLNYNSTPSACRGHAEYIFIIVNTKMKDASTEKVNSGLYISSIGRRRN